jgi:hypothetical protein
MATFARLPLDLQRMILVPDATYRTSLPTAFTIDTLLCFHIWSRHLDVLASDVRRLRFFASTNGTVLRVSKSQPIVRNELRLPVRYWQYVPPIRHLSRRASTTR